MPDAAQTPMSDHITSVSKRLLSGEWRLILEHPNPAEGTAVCSPDVSREVGRRLSTVTPADVGGLVERLEGIQITGLRANIGVLGTRPIAAANAAISQAASALRLSSSGWMPISRAPKDDLIDIWIDNRDGSGVRWCDCYYDRICDEWRTSRPSGRLLTIKSRHVTHWMPRPSAPALEDGQDGQ